MFIDTSGSISDEMLQGFNKEIKDIMANYERSEEAKVARLKAAFLVTVRTKRRKINRLQRQARKNNR